MRLRSLRFEADVESTCPHYLDGTPSKYPQYDTDTRYFWTERAARRWLTARCAHRAGCTRFRWRLWRGDRLVDSFDAKVMR
jgi:hypothetical protein